MNIYFAGSIRAGRVDWILYRGIIEILKRFGTVLSEHLGDSALEITGEDLPDKTIHDRDLGWLKSSDVVFAEVTRPSLGVGYEIGKATEWGKPVICVYRSSVTPSLSAMIAGADGVSVYAYESTAQLTSVIEKHFCKSPPANQD